MLSFFMILMISGCAKNADIIEKNDEKKSAPTVAISGTTAADIDNDAIGDSTSECIHAKNSMIRFIRFLITLQNL